MPHIHEKIDFTATAYIVYKDTVLLRMHDKYKMWLGVGGHIELDEDPNQALIREIKEEVGLDVELERNFDEADNPERYKELVPPDRMNIHYIGDTEHQHMDMVYFVRSDSNAVVPGGSDKSEEWKWFTEAELEDPKFNIPARVVRQAKEALNKLS